MKISSLLFLLVFSFSLLNAQTEKFDIATYIAPKGWTKTKKEGVVIYSRSDSATGGYCIIALYAATPSAGAPQKNFTNEWKELAVAPYNAKANPSTETQTTADGWKAVAGAATASLDGIDSYVILTVYSGFGKTSSVMANLNDQSYIPELEKFLENIRFDKKAKIAVKPVPVSPGNNSRNNRVVGQWTKSSGSPSQYNNGVLVNLVHFGHYTGQYSFNADGTYRFHGEAKTNSDSYRLIDEAGKYTVSGDQLILVPSKGSHRQVKGNGALVKTDKLSLTKRVYSWQLQYFEELQEHNLVLTTAAENIVDGGFSGNFNFPNSYLYAQPSYKIEWKFDF